MILGAHNPPWNRKNTINSKFFPRGLSMDILPHLAILHQEGFRTSRNDFHTKPGRAKKINGINIRETPAHFLLQTEERGEK